ncbi:MAG TPA: benzoate/H(+) symporter BenE family transporter [Solirubrobacteraceae bacterium]|nr:benzoate/H(+) symporter BenE family transporter [Solirubrobacteraceae bacterium]
MKPAGASQPVIAGVVASLVGFASTFTLVLAGLRAVGASEAQAASGLATLCLTMSVVAIWLGVRYRQPLAIAWSTPGAALLVAGGEVPGGYPAALGAFAVAGALIVLAGLWRTLGRWVEAIPPALASAMLAGVLLPVCLAPVTAAVALPAQVLPVIGTWVVLMRVARPWAVPGALAAAAIVIALDPQEAAAPAGLLPSLTVTAPTLDPGALLGLALPLFVVTMASQNVTGIAVLASFGYRAPIRPALVSTGAATVAGAPFGAHAINLAAITAALAAGPDAHPDPARRWIASVAGGVTYLVVGLTAGLAAALVAVAPPLLIEAVAGLALFGALAGALAAAMADAERRDAAIVTFVVSASGIAVAGISAPFWGLVAGLAYAAVQRARVTRAEPGSVTA